ncbi:Rv0361 family membrane protein, partial [Geodermatophilus nigrescens]
MTAQPGEAPARDDLPRWTPGPRDWVVDAIPSPAPPGRRRRRGLLAGAVLLAVVALVGGVVASSVLGSRPDSPSEVVEQYLTADQRHDWTASWALLCSVEQEAAGSFEAYVRVKDATMATTGVDVADITVVVGGARPWPDTPASYLVTFWMEHDGQMRREEMAVVEQDGGFRVCGG